VKARFDDVIHAYFSECVRRVQTSDSGWVFEHGISILPTQNKTGMSNEDGSRMAVSPYLVPMRRKRQRVSLSPQAMRSG
jgi:hypothetical protein